MTTESQSSNPNRASPARKPTRRGRSESSRRAMSQQIAVPARATVETLPAYQIAIPGLLSESRVQVRPRVTTRRTLRPRDPSEADVVVLYNVALGLERGRPEDILSDAETEEVARAVGETLREHVRSIELAPVWDDLGDVLRQYDPARHVIFNLCESLGGRAWSEAEVLRLMRAAGFVHTGSSHHAPRAAGRQRTPHSYH